MTQLVPMNCHPELNPISDSEADPLSEIRQEHEVFLTDLEAAAVKALATGDWNDVESCIFFYNPQTKSYDV